MFSCDKQTDLETCEICGIGLLVSPHTGVFTVSSGPRDNDISGRGLCSNCN